MVKYTNNILGYLMKKFFLMFFLMISSAKFSFAEDIAVKALSEMTTGQQETLHLSHPIDNAWLWWFTTGNATQQPSIQIVDSKFGKEIPFQSSTPNNANCYVVMVDSSKSMQPYWSSVIDSMKSVVDTASGSVSVFSFAETPNEMVAINSQLGNDLIKQKITDLSAQGKDTQLFFALKDVLEKVNTCSAPRQHLVVFSDGDAEDKAITLQEVVDMANTKKVSIHTVGFGDLSKSKTALKLQVLSTLSDKTHGSYHHFSDSSGFDLFVKKMVTQHSSTGTLSIDATAFPFLADSVKVTYSMTLQNGETKTTEISLNVNDTANWQNVLVSIRMLTGVQNPWLVIIAIGSTLLVLLALLFFFKYQSNQKRKALEQQAQIEKEEEKQRSNQRDQEMKEALVAMQQKIEEFQPDQTVNKQGTPYAWLQDAQGQYYELVTYSTTIGRDTENAIVLHDPTVSRSHAILDYKNGQLVWTDRAPSNPTVINGKKIDGSHRLMPSDVIDCGKVRLQLKLSKV